MSITWVHALQAVQIKTNDKTFAPRSHGGTEKAKKKWILFGPLIDGCVQHQSPDISGFSLQQKNEDTEVLNSLIRSRINSSISDVTIVLDGTDSQRASADYGRLS
jgi:hypothetical protein